MLTRIVLDLGVLLVLGLSVWRGFKRGLIMSLAGVVILLVSLWGATYVSNNFSDQIAGVIEPLIGWMTDDATDQAIAQKGTKDNIRTSEDMNEVSVSAFLNMGISQAAADKMTEQVTQVIDQTGQDIRKGISSVFTSILIGFVVFLFALVIIAIVLTLIFNAISIAFKLPGLNIIDKVGGVAMGAVWGCLIIYAITLGFHFLGVVIDQEVIDQTFLFRFFLNVNPLRGIVNI